MVFCLIDLDIFAVRDVLQFAVVAPFANDSVHGFGVESHVGGEVCVGLAVELVGQGFKELRVDRLSLGC